MLCFVSKFENLFLLNIEPSLIQSMIPKVTAYSTPVNLVDTKWEVINRGIIFSYLNEVPVYLSQKQTKI